MRLALTLMIQHCLFGAAFLTKNVDDIDKYGILVMELDLTEN